MRTIGDRRADIPLSIAMDYPVGWSFRIVLRDLIQNFYDAIGTEHFAEEFQFVWDKNEQGFDLTMKTHGHSFSHEWLTYIGGSTKTEENGKHIGMYGEGFKIAVLRIIQLGGMDLTMHSADWQIRPAIYTETIDGQALQMLAYEYETVPDDVITELQLFGIPLSNRK